MSGSSYWPMSAVYVHGTAPLSRIHATATEVSRPPEKAIPTRSPTGREVSTLDTSTSMHGHAWLCKREVGGGSDLAGEGRPQGPGQLVPHAGVDHQPGAGDRLGGRPPTLGPDHDVAVAVEDQRRHAYPGERGPPVGSGPDGRLLSGGPAARQALVVAGHGPPAEREQVLPFRGVGRRTGDLLHRGQEVGHLLGGRGLAQPAGPPDEREPGARAPSTDPG